MPSQALAPEYEYLITSINADELLGFLNRLTFKAYPEAAASQCPRVPYIKIIKMLFLEIEL